jgi:hypothetical protein
MTDTRARQLTLPLVILIISYVSNAGPASGSRFGRAFARAVFQAQAQQCRQAALDLIIALDNDRKVTCIAVDQHPIDYQISIEGPCKIRLTEDPVYPPRAG